MQTSMRTTLIRRHFPRGWAAFSRTAVALVVAQALWLALGHCAHAATTVSYRTLQATDGFDAIRVYAGRTVAGRASELGFRQGGELAALHVDIGDYVEKDDLLAELDTASLEAGLAQAEADVNLAAANLRALEAETQLARQTEARFRTLRDSGHTSAQVYDEQRLALRAKEAQLSVAVPTLQRAKANQRAADIAIEEASLHAPFSGQVQNRMMDEGAQAGPGMSIFRLVETADREAHVGIPESMVDHLQPGSTYTLRWAKSRISATLKTLLPEVDPDSRTVMAVLRLTDETIPFGAVVELELSYHVDAPGFWLPLSALTESDRGLWGAYVIDAHSHAERRLVEILHMEADRAYVRGTLNPGERVIDTGVQRIVPGQQVGMTQRN
jgi:RND family efflux transporter MFP subunit